MKHSLIKKLKEHGGIIIKPNPIINNWLLFQIPKAANRYHQKVKLIDNDLFIGSLNSNNQYAGIKYGTFDFIDLSLYMKNSPWIKKVAKFFIDIVKDNKIQIKDYNKRITNIKISNRVNQPQLESPSHQQAITSKIPSDEEFLEENPPKKSEIQDAICEMLNNAKESITIVQSYYLNIKKIEEILLRAIKRGVKIEIITAKKRDQLFYKHFVNELLFEKLLLEGVRVYEFFDKSFHIKAYLVDHKILTLGSFNNDITSFLCNNETNYLLRKNNHNQDVFNQFNTLCTQLKENCKEVIYIPNIEISKKRRFLFAFFNYGLWMMGIFLTNRKEITDII